VGQWVPVAGVSENALKARRDHIVAVTRARTFFYPLDTVMRFLQASMRPKFSRRIPYNDNYNANDIGKSEFENASIAICILNRSSHRANHLG